MAGLSIRVLGPIQVSLNGEPVSGFASDKVRALLAYLALSPERTHRRSALSGLLWPDFPESAARANLRNALANLRLVIADHLASPPFLCITRQTIHFNDQSDYWLDADTFKDLITEEPASGEALEQAAGLVRGHFMEGFSLADAAPFEEWQLLMGEQFNRQLAEALDSLVAICTSHRDYESALVHTRRRVEMEPWQESGQQQLMRLLAQNGQREAALRQFEICKQALWDEIGVEPSKETIALYKQIQENKFAPLSRLPGFLTGKKARREYQRPFFVGRETALARLDGFIAAASAGKGGMTFVTGGPGRGKTAMLEAFTHRAMQAYPDLLVAGGKCNAYAGVGDPYLPFREVLSIFSGDVESRWESGAISRDYARRLWSAFPLIVRAVLDHGPQLLDVIIPGEALLERSRSAGGDIAHMLPRLTDHLKRAREWATGVEQSHIFQQVTSVFCHLARERPLLLILDDLQWADAASSSLLFHLGRNLFDRECRILIACAYRPDEVALGRSDQRHPLAIPLSEFKKTFGDVWLDLGRVTESEGRGFVDALLDAEPNALDGKFSADLYTRTGGHPLFTIELLRAMQERGDLIKDSNSAWIKGPSLDWDVLPARVGAVIEERIERLDSDLLEMLTVAGVEGEAFTAQVIAEVLNIPERQALRGLSNLERQHRLVREHGDIEAGDKRLSRFSFSHILFQDYLYKRLSMGEQRLLHGDVAGALEQLYAGDIEEIAVQLAHHFDQNKNFSRAFDYYSLAAERATRFFDSEEAINHYTRAIELAEMVSPDVAALAKLHRERGIAYERLGSFEQADADHTRIVRLAQSAGDSELEWRAAIDQGKLWRSRDYSQAHGFFETALGLARSLDKPAITADSLNWMGNWYANQENSKKAIAHHQEALAIFEEIGNQEKLAYTLDLLAISNLLGGGLNTAVHIFDRAIRLFRKSEDLPMLITSLLGRGMAVTATLWLASIPPNPAPDAASDFEEALQIAREIDSTPDQAWASYGHGMLHLIEGDFGNALRSTQSGLKIATEIEHLEHQVGSMCTLGTCYTKLNLPDQAFKLLEGALTLARELRSQIWINLASGSLAETHLSLNDLNSAQTCLQRVISASTPMDTLQIRFCWANLAELALSQGDPDRALEITDRLIATAPGMAPGNVITHLWKLKGEALAVKSNEEEALSYLETAKNNAQANGERFLLWRIHASLSHLYNTMQRRQAAAEEHLAARALIDEIANTIPEKAMRENFRQGTLDSYTLR